MQSKLKRATDKQARQNERQCIQDRVRLDSRHREEALEIAHSAKNEAVVVYRTERQREKMVVPPFKRRLGLCSQAAPRY